MKLYTIYYKIQAKHDEGKCQYYTHLNNYSRNFSDRQNQSACLTEWQTDPLTICNRLVLRIPNLKYGAQICFKKKKKHIVQCFSSDTICISESTGHTLGPEDNNYFVLWLTSMYILGMHYQFLFIQFFVL